jgi:activator of HSP90 ATPase
VNDENNNNKGSIKPVLRKELTPLIIKSFDGFSAAMIKENCDDVFIEQNKMGQATPPRLSTPAPKETSSATQFASNTTSTKTAAPQKVNTTTLTDSVDFQTSAHEIYETLLDPQRAQIWTRGPVKLSKDINSDFEFFNGNVSGKILELIPDKKIVQSWRLKSWPAGHFSEVTIDLNQGSDSTVLNIKQTGVPIGQEELTQTNWSGYYWRAIKGSFGFGAVF